jgi:ClpP class serine protease
MNILSAICGARWAITPDALRGIIAIAQRRSAGVDTRAFHAPDAALRTAARGQSMKGTHYANLVGDTAVIALAGPIFPHANLMTQMSGATSLEFFTDDFARAHDDPSVAHIVLDIDSPGGVATGIADAADLIAASDKPVTAVISGLGCSAAYWIASAAGRIVVSQSALVGSIGVVSAWSKQVAPDQHGEMTFEIVSSNAPNKRPDPSAEEGVDEIRRTLDALETLFIGAVAANRGVGVEAVRSGFGQGGIVVGRQAVDRLMADEVGTLESVLAGLATPSASHHQLSAEETTHMDTITHPAPAPDAAAIAAEAQQTATSAERARVQGLLALKTKMPGHAALIDTMIGDGTSLDQARARVIDAEAAVRPGRETLEGMTELGRALDPSLDRQLQSFANLPLPERALAEVRTSPELRAEYAFAAHEPVETLAARHAAYLKATEDGRVRMLTRPEPKRAA